MYTVGFFGYQDSDNDMNLIEDGLYLGCIEAARGAERLRKTGITHVLGLLDSFRFYDQYDGIEYMLIELPDYYNQNILQYLPQALGFIAKGLRTGKVLVHCAAGVSRSASIVVAYTMVKHSLTFTEAATQVRSKRSCIWPNEGFQKQISSINVNEYKQYLA